MTRPLDLDALDFEKGGGLVTVVAQDASTGAVLMVAFADRVALERTLETGEMHYHSRRRGLWHKGLASGSVQRVVSLSADCDGDAVLARVHSTGAACHTGDASCFGGAAVDADALASLDAVIASRAADRSGPSPSYTRRLLTDRNLRLKKLGEECAELVVALGDGDAERATAEAADLVYHALVALRALGVGLDEVRTVLSRREREGRAP
ncbi:MAG TPA: bifunctional phosphoribosyl-AMP cyclohydrolase/phosphoribosyl-ATP diphosphatase HisIE [Gemmatimonadaceae bacterium]|nr:bifunctional phosphoribosyl-AMP cyclohydrolase/phosphoribosyl-ATP diphosphatase HisIE [Gemmatimonadaceae bacterium]